MSDDQVTRLRDARKWFNDGQCCGQVDSAGICAAPACIFGEALKEFSRDTDRIEVQAAEIAALQKRVAELEYVLRAKVTEIERAYSHEGHCIECHGVVRAWGDTEHRDDCWYVKARAALEGKKDEQ